MLPLSLNHAVRRAQSWAGWGLEGGISMDSTLMTDFVRHCLSFCHDEALRGESAIFYSPQPYWQKLTAPNPSRAADAWLTFSI